MNNCQPDCAQGTTVDVPVSVALSAPVNGSFTGITLTDSSGNTNTYAAGSNGLLSPISDALYIADEPSAAPANSNSPAPSAPSCTIPPTGYYPGGHPGHLNSSGFCVMDGQNGNT